MDGQVAAVVSFDQGNMTWLMVSCICLVLMIGGLKLLYAGQARRKNAVSTAFQVFMSVNLVIVLAAVCGYSLATTPGSPFLGGFDKAFLEGLFGPSGVTPAATFSKGVYQPELLTAVFWTGFGAITTGLIVGAFAERMKPAGALVFAGAWFLLTYVPLARMVWYWAGPDAYTATADVTALNASAGWLWQLGVLDTAGGLVVHWSAGLAGLMCAMLLRPRKPETKEKLAAHSQPLIWAGTMLLWAGWFGFNAGSALEANGTAALAFANTFFAPATAALAWVLIEWSWTGKATQFGACCGILAGLVGITPACGYVGIGGGLAIGAACGVACFFACTWLKARLRYDDAFDVFGIHGVAGGIGSVLTGVFVNPVLGGTGYVTNWVTGETGYSSYQVVVQIEGLAIAAGLVLVGTMAALFVTRLALRAELRIVADVEARGLDADHDEQAYNFTVPGSAEA